MLARRIIPCLDVHDGRVVKGVRFQDTRDAGDPVELAARYDDEGADELVFYDISASAQGRRTMIEVVARTAERVFIPLTVGGGVADVEAMRALLRAGADKVSINTAAVADPDLIDRGAQRFGSQCIVLSIDARRTGPGRWEVVTHGGRRATGRDALEWAAEGERRGAGELVLNSIDADGTRDGYDLDLCRAVAERVRIPLVASGGAGSAEHMVRVLTEGRADAALAASVFHYGDLSIPAVKAQLAARGVPVRPLPWYDGLRYGADGLVPVAVQDAGTGEVLMLAYADREALRRTAAERRAWFWSRSRGELWRKGDTSGNAMDVVEVRWDCDADAVLYRVRPAGPACHTGERTCFHRGEAGPAPEPASLGAEWEMLHEVALDRLRRRPEGSYVARLAAEGLPRVAQKVGEEGLEVVIAALGSDRRRLVEELADLFFHSAVLVAATGLDPAEVTAELRRRRR